MTASAFHPTKGLSPRKQFVRIVVMEAANSFGGLTFSYRQLVDASVALFKTKKPQGILPENTISHTLTDFLREKPAPIERIQMGVYRVTPKEGQQDSLPLTMPIPTNNEVTPTELRSHMHHVEGALKSVDEMLRQVLLEVKLARELRSKAAAPDCLHPNWSRAYPANRVPGPAVCHDCGATFTPDSEVPR